MTTLIDALANAADSAACLRFIDGKERETRYLYGDVYHRALKMASVLAERGIRPGDRVAIILPTGIHFFDAFFGVMACGAIPVPMYPPLRLGRLDEYHARTAAMLRACEAALLITDQRINRMLGRTIEAYRPRDGVLQHESVEGFATNGASSPQGSVAVAGNACDQEQLLEPHTISADDLGFIQFSSGTTAQPKPIGLTHRQILANVHAIMGAIVRAYPETEERHSGCSWLPLYHDMGLVGCVFVAIAYARDLTLIPPEQFLAKPALWLRAVSRYRATVSPAPNFAYSLCVDRIRDEELQGVDLSSWHVALNGAEPVTPKVLERFVERFSTVGFPEHSLTPVYGLGEATLAVTFSDLSAPWRWQSFDRHRLALEREAHPVQTDGVDLVSLGPPLPGFSIQIRSEMGTICKACQVGQVWVAGPSVMRGYVGMAERNSQVFDGEWLNTGDRGFLMDGELYLFGRDKDVIVLKGKNFAPQDIEAALDPIPDIRRGCVAAVGCCTSEGEQLRVLVETPLKDEHGQRVLREAIQAAVLARCALSPEVSLLAPGVLPRTSSGKIARVRARDFFESGQLTAPKPVTVLNLAKEMARSYLAHWRTKS